MKTHRTFASVTLTSVTLTSVIALAAALLGCRDTPTAPGLTTTLASSAINAAGDADAPEIVFLAPLGPKRHPRGVLDTTLAPSVAVCRLHRDACDAADTLARFSFDSTDDSTRHVTQNEHAFHVPWSLKGLPSDPAIAYRVVVSLGDTTVGFTDLKIVAPDYVPPPDDTARFAFITERNGLNIRFRIFVPPVTLTVIAEPGVRGNLTSQTYSVRRGDRVQYDFTADSGYTNALVTLDQAPMPKHGRITMDDSHVLIASADRKPGVAPGDEWILRESRALLTAGDKVASAQKLLDKLGAMEDTTNVLDRLHRVEMTLLQRDADASAMPALDAALAGHDFDAGGGIGSRDDVPPPAGGGGGVSASALLVPLHSAQLHPSAGVNPPTASGAEPVTIAYVNGILTTPLGALFAAHHVAIAAREAHWNSNVPFDVRLMYNRSAVASAASAEEKCVLELGIKGDWLGLNSLPGAVAKCLGSTEPKALELLADYTEAGEQFISVLDHSIAVRPTDVDSVAAFTTRLRNEGRHVVFVMHSQGNLIVQQALTLLNRRGEYSQSRDTTCIGGVALASPTSEGWPISARHLHGLVVDGDAILLLGRNKFPQVRTPLSDSAAGAATGSISARIMGLATGARLRWRLRLHGLIESYLMQQPMRDSIESAIVSSYNGCALGTVAVTPQSLVLHTGDVGSFNAALLDLNGDPLDGKRGLSWKAESQTDLQRAVSLSPSGVANARYVGGTSVTAVTRDVTANAGVTVNPAPLHVTAREALSAAWVLVFPPSLPRPDVTPIPPFVIPATSWDGGGCAEHTEFQSNGRTGTVSKECTEDYLVSSDPFAGADSYTASFFEKNTTAALFSVSSRTVPVHGSTSGPAANLDLLAGPIPMDRIGMTAFDAAGHLLASGNACLRGCVGWPPGL